MLDGLLIFDASRGGTTLAWLRRAAVSNSPKAILHNIEKLEFLKRAGVAGWTLDGLSPNRLKRWPRLPAGPPAKPSSGCRKNGGIHSWWPSSTSRWSISPTRRSTSSIAAWRRLIARAGHDLEEFRGSVAQTTNEMVRLFGELARVVLDPTVRDAQLRHAIYRRIPAERLRRVVEESTRIVRPDDDSGFDFLRRRYGHLRQFIPAFLAAFPFRSNIDPDPLLEAVDLLRRLSERRSRNLPRRTTVDFVPPKWRPYVIDGQGRIDRGYFELCVLSELHGLAGR